jgi:2'-5' RNA ligase
VHESALIIEVPEADDLVARWRAHHDPIASHGVPPHITALYPFVPPRSLGESCARDVTSQLAPWEYRLTRVEQFPRVVWLRPEPTDPFIDLTMRLWRAFPEHPPFGGLHDDLVPHLTVAHVALEEDQAVLATRIAEDLTPHLPITCTARGLALYVSADHRDWQCLHRFPFGG